MYLIVPLIVPNKPSLFFLSKAAATTGESRSRHVPSILKRLVFSTIGVLTN